MTTLLQVENVTVRFGGLVALNNVSFTLNPGEIVGLIGPNGAGKTTLFSTLVGLVKPSEGRIVIEGERIDGKRPHQVARHGMTKTFQNVSLFPDMNVRDNVVVAALSHSNLADARRTADAALERLGLASIADAEVADLTFPQRALVEVARAMATRARILLLDEVMAALNPAEMDAVMDVLSSLRDEGLTLFVVEHHMRAIMRLCDRILALQFGGLIASGTPAEIAANPVVIEAYLGREKSKEA
ncbi:ABC transporter ATP-binding protein [Acidovorax soli]|uniref:Branched-chain amino acid transport system ATP-binding protein n=1 Tax=Acidovorax soli TaxID=592050 RepID=A0A1H4FDA1_9BURK|nr:ABC transporter ATP-binding protein [Acidovorax soli]SEA95266.1 branched-chain amino acid transport system ATP-binding protein [Acidovorax soli]